LTVAAGNGEDGFAVFNLVGDELGLSRFVLLIGFGEYRRVSGWKLHPETAFGCGNLAPQQRGVEFSDGFRVGAGHFGQSSQT